MFFFAHAPNAALPPALFTSATIMPRITRNINIPAVPETAAIKPSFTMLSSALTGEKFAEKSPPTTIPTKSEL